jgi:hypothetical protein
MKSNIKIIFSSIILIATLLIIIWKISPNATSPDPTNGDIKSTSKRERPGDKNHGPTNGKSETTESNNNALLPVDAAAKDAILDKIHEASVTYNAANLPIIKPYLLSPDPEIRQEAVSGMVILGEAAASPMLREAAKHMNTAEDVKIMLEAAEYLELPRANLKELLNKKKNKATPPPAPSDPSQPK